MSRCSNTRKVQLKWQPLGCHAQRRKTGGRASPGGVSYIVWRGYQRLRSHRDFIRTQTEENQTKDRKIYSHGKYISPTGTEFAPGRSLEDLYHCCRPFHIMWYEIFVCLPRPLVALTDVHFGLILQGQLSIP